MSEVAKVNAISGESVLTLASAFSVLTPKKIADLAVSQGLSKAAFIEAVSRSALSDEAKNEAISLYAAATAKGADAAATNTLTFSMGSLTTAITANIAAMLAWMASNPVGWILGFASAIAIGVGGTVVAAKAYNKAIEESIKKSQELQDAYTETFDTISGNISTIKDLADEFKDLSKGVGDHGENIALSSSEYERYVEVVNQLVGLNPTLVKGYTDEGNAIIDKNAAIQSTIDLLKEQQALELANATSDDNNWEIAEGLRNAYKQELKDVETAQTELVSALHDALAANLEMGYDYKWESIGGHNAKELYAQFEEMFGVTGSAGGGINATQWNRLFNSIADSSVSAGEIISNNLEYINSLLDGNSEAAAAFNNALQRWQTAQKTADQAATAYQSHMKIIAQASVGYDELGNSSKEFLNTWIESQKLTGKETEASVDAITDSIQNMVQVLANGAIIDFSSNISANVRELSQQLLDIEKEMSEYEQGNVKLSIRPEVDTGDGNYATVLSSWTDAFLPDDKTYAIHYTPILADGTMLDEDEVRAELDRLIEGAVSSSDILELDKVENGGKGIILRVNAKLDTQTDDQFFDSENAWGQSLHEMQEEYFNVIRAMREDSEFAPLIEKAQILGDISDDTAKSLLGLSEAIIALDTNSSDVDFNAELDKLYAVNWDSLGGAWYDAARKQSNTILARLTQAFELTDEQVVELKLALGLVVVDPETGNPIDTRDHYIKQLKNRGLLLDESALSVFSAGDLKLLLSANVNGISDVEKLNGVLEVLKRDAENAAAALEGLSALAEHLASDADILRTAIASISNGDIDSVFTSDNIDAILDKFPDLADEMQAYADGLIDAEQLQRAFNDALNDFTADEIYDGINDIVDACETYGAESNRVKQAVQNLESVIPGLVDALYDEETGHLLVSSAAMGSATSLYEVAKATIESARQAEKMELSNAIQELEEIRNAAMEAAMSLTWYGNAAEMAQRIDAYDNAQGFDTVIAKLRQQLDEIDVLYNEKLSTLSSAQSRYNRTSSSSKEVEKYTAEIDKFREAMERLDRLQREQERVELHLSNTDDLDKQIDYHNQLIGIYRDEQAAMHELNEERDAYIQSGVDKLRGAGFEVEYDAVNNNFFVKNLEHLNELVAKSRGEYSSMQEATNAYIKEMEDLIDELTDLNEANIENSESWWDLQYSIREAKVNIVNNLKDIVSAASDAVDEIQNVYDVLKEAADEYAANGGFISIDAYQKIVELGPEYMQYLRDENGLLIINEEAVNRVIAAKTEQLALENAMSYVERLRLALQEDSVEDLNNLLYATTEATDATWGLVYANLALLDLNSDQYQAALHNIQAIRSLAETAVAGIGQVAGGYADELNNMKSGLDDILDYVMDMLQDQVERQIDSLENLKDSYSEIITQRKEMLELAQREKEYQDEVNDKTAELAKLESRRAALEGAVKSGDRNAALELGSVTEQIKELQDELNDYQYEHYVETTEDALDKELEDFEAQQDEKIAILEDSISSTQKIYDMALDYISKNWDTLYNELIQWNYSYGSNLESEISDAWANCLAAAQRYGSYIEALNSIDADIASAGSSSSGYSSNTIVGNSNYDASSTTEENIHAIIKRMYANAQAWFDASSAQRTTLAEENVKLAARLSAEYGINATRGHDGTWYVGNEKLFEKYRDYCFHTGGIVGGDVVATPKQNELWALLKKKEMVITEAQQNNLWNILSSLSPVNALREAFSSLQSGSLTQAIGGPTFQIEAPVYVDGTLPEQQIMKLLKRQSRDIANEIYSYLK